MSVSDSLGTLQWITSIQNSFGPKETMDRLQTEIRAKEMNLFARVDHSTGAAEVGLNLRPTELIIFGNARGDDLTAVCKAWNQSSNFVVSETVQIQTGFLVTEGKSNKHEHKHSKPFTRYN